MAGSGRTTRRGLLRGAVGVGSAVAVGALAAQEGSPPHDRKLTSDPGPDDVTHPSYRPTFFSPAEWAFVCAAVDRLVPRDETGPGALELGVAEYIDRALQSPYGEGSRWYMHGPFPKAAPNSATSRS